MEKEKVGNGVLDKAESDQYLDAVGISGKWQFRMIMVSGLFCVPTAWHVLIMTFMNAKVDNWCARPPELVNLTVEAWKNISGQHNQTCQVRDIDWSNFDLVTGEISSDVGMVDCTEWEYDRSQFLTTITGDFDLVCGRSSLVGFAQTLYFVGMILGVLTFGILADIFGRKTILIPLLLCACITGTITSQMPTFTYFAIMRVVNAFFIIGIFETQFTYCIEFVGGKWSTIVGMGMEYFWVAGWLTLALLGYLIRSWRWLTLAISLPSMSALLMIWLVPESPRWLLSKGRLEEAEKIIRSAAAENKKCIPDNWKLKPVQSQEKQSKVTVLDLFRTRNMRTKILILYYNFFVNAFLYFGLTLNIGDLGGDVFINFTASGLLEIPAYGAAIIVLMKCGRRIPYGTSLIMSGLFLLSVSFVPRGVYEKDWPCMVLALLGKTCVTFSFGALFVYAAELVPTEIRTSAIGSASFLGRIGGIIAPWVGKLSEVHPYLPVGIFGLNAILAGSIAFFLPETQGIDLPYTIEESEQLELSSLLPKRKKKT